MRKVALESGDEVIRLSSYDTTDYSFYSISNPGNAYGNNTSSYCQVELTRGSGAETYFYFKFDTSSIPQDAEIDSISCVTRVNFSDNTTTNVVSKGAKVCSGTTEKTGTISVTRTVTNRTFTMGTWTREELNDVRIKFYATRGKASVNSSIYFRIYVGTLTVNYTVYETYYDVSCSSNSPSISFSGDGEHSSGDNVTITITGDLTGAIVTDNGVDVTSSLSGSGTTHTYAISGIAADHAIVVTVPSTGQEIFVKQNGSWVAVDTVYVKQNGVWKEVETLSIKQNGSWVN